jgi:hypothetical protein
MNNFSIGMPCKYNVFGCVADPHHVDEVPAQALTPYLLNFFKYQNQVIPNFNLNNIISITLYHVIFKDFFKSIQGEHKDWRRSYCHVNIQFRLFDAAPAPQH